MISVIINLLISQALIPYGHTYIHTYILHMYTVHERPIVQPGAQRKSWSTSSFPRLPFFSPRTIWRAGQRQRFGTTAELSQRHTSTYLHFCEDDRVRYSRVFVWKVVTAFKFTCDIFAGQTESQKSEGTLSLMCIYTTLHYTTHTHTHTDERRHTACKSTRRPRGLRPALSATAHMRVWLWVVMSATARPDMTK